MLVVIQWVGCGKDGLIFDTVKDCLRKRGLDVRQTRRMVEICEVECMGYSPGDEPLTWKRCYSCGLKQLFEAIEGGSPSVGKHIT